VTEVNVNVADEVMLDMPHPLVKVHDEVDLRTQPSTELKMNPQLVTASSAALEYLEYAIPGPHAHGDSIGNRRLVTPVRYVQYKLSSRCAIPWIHMVPPRNTTSASALQ
jgi:hypothetical protein